MPRTYSCRFPTATTKAQVYIGNGVERRMSKDEAPIIFDAPALITVDEWKKAHRPVKGRKIVKDAGKRVHDYALSMRLKHLHQDGTAAGMFGMARPSGGGKRRWYRCGAARATETTTATCDGLGVVNKQEMTSVQADLVEALTLRWILTQEPEAWKALYEQALEAAEVASFDIEEGEKRIAHLEVTITRIKDGFDSGLYRADEAAQRSAGYLAEIEGIEEDIKQAHQRGDDLALRGLTIGELMGMEIEDHDGFEYETDEYPIMASQRREELLIAVATTLGTPDRYGRTPGLPEHARNEVERLARLLDVVVYIGRNDDDPRRPRYLVDFSPEGALTLEGLKQGESCPC